MWDDCPEKKKEGDSYIRESRVSVPYFVRGDRRREGKGGGVIEACDLNLFSTFLLFSTSKMWEIPISQIATHFPLSFLPPIFSSCKCPDIFFSAARTAVSLKMRE